ncbi:hypothetical protein GJR96_07530 [Haloferax sp. MBLA0076]|uniref:Uncharacterized protein n=1 Tax=Haloferax litoreum TaxID=2666140 RepID=A0A6A8GG09_9EURY|nr:MULTISPECIES: hypothetical protein [Haloferax]KAB1193303.1 hypothetical protein Hfx1148_07525 [Haloferax sp. CBA1148]MRX21806.1 hypothetical protein [Haloferax litoreum]
MLPENAPTRFDAALLGMALCLAAGVGGGVVFALPTYVATGGGATGAAAVALGVTVSELT